MGLYPCPCCIIPKEDIFRAGEPADMEARRTLAWKDNDEYRKKMGEARRLIYKKGYVVNSDRIEKELKDESLVPTWVIDYLTFYGFVLTHCESERVFKPSPPQLWARHVRPHGS